MNEINKRRIQAVYDELISKPKLNNSWYLGFLEASLVSVGYIKEYTGSYLKSLVKTKLVEKWWGYKEVPEDRSDLILRLTKEYLEHE